MIILPGKYAEAKVFTNNVESSAISQIIELCCQPFVEDCKVRIMPDVHAGKGCTIGTTLTIENKVVPNLVGVDIGCGMFVMNLGDNYIDLEKLDKFIHNYIPHGFGVNKKAQTNFTHVLNRLECLPDLNKTVDDFNLAIGSLGGGNHFIEINQASNGDRYLVIHSGSRNLGVQIANYYQKMAIGYHDYGKNLLQVRKEELIKQYKLEKKEKLIPDALNDLEKESGVIQGIPSYLAYLEGEQFTSYLHDMTIVQRYAKINREMIAQRIVYELKLKALDMFHTVHNYIDTDNMILRKGAVSAQVGERLIIPMNMRDGSLLCIGKGNEDWNYSAPHGAGRLMSRSNAKQSLSMEEFKDSMENIFTTSVSKSTLDESPMAYKSMEEIISNIGDTVEVVDIMKPVYNFKSGG